MGIQREYQSCRAIGLVIAAMPKPALPVATEAPLITPEGLNELLFSLNRPSVLDVRSSFSYGDDGSEIPYSARVAQDQVAMWWPVSLQIGRKIRRIAAADFPS